MEWWSKYQGLIGSAGIFFPEEDWLQLKSSHGRQLRTYRYPCEAPRALLVIVHGMGYHANTYSHVAKRFAESQVLVVSLDQEFHGRSEGEKGRIDRMEDFSVDTKRFIDQCVGLYPDLPVFVLGESMGGFVAAHLTTLFPAVRGLILLAPALGVDPDYEKCIRRMLRCLGTVTPWLPLKAAELDRMSRNEHFVQWATDDPLVDKTKVKAGTGLRILRSLEAVPQWLPRVQTPMLVIQGGEDHVIDKAIVRQFVETSSVEDKQLIYIEEMRHLISCEPNFPELLEEMVAWVGARV